MQIQIYRYLSASLQVSRSERDKETSDKIAKPSILSFQHGGRRHIPTGLLHDRRIVGRFGRIVSLLVAGHRTGREI